MITVTMTETVTYQRTLSLYDLATALDTEPTEDAVRAALDASNSNYGTTDEYNEALLDLMVPGNDVSASHVVSVDDRSWEFS